MDQLNLENKVENLYRELADIDVKQHIITDMLADLSDKTEPSNFAIENVDHDSIWIPDSYAEEWLNIIAQDLTEEKGRLKDELKVVEWLLRLVTDINLEDCDSVDEFLAKELEKLGWTVARPNITLKKLQFILPSRAWKTVCKAGNIEQPKSDTSIAWLNGFPAKEFLKIRGCGHTTLVQIIDGCKRVGLNLDLSNLPEKYKGE